MQLTRNSVMAKLLNKCLNKCKPAPNSIVEMCVTNFSRGPSVVRTRTAEAFPTISNETSEAQWNIIN